MHSRLAPVLAVARPSISRRLIAACVLVCALPGCMAWYYCSKAAIALHGSVVDADTGAPLPGVAVRVGNQEVLGQTGEDGTFTGHFTHRWADKVGVIQRIGRVDNPTPRLHLELTKKGYAAASVNLPLESRTGDGSYVLVCGPVYLRRE